MNTRRPGAGPVSLPLAYLVSSVIPSFWLAEWVGSSWQVAAQTYTERPSLATLSKIASPPQGTQYHIPVFMQCLELPEVSLFVYLCSCLLSVFTIQGHLHDNSRLAQVVHGCIHPLC